MWLFDGAGEGVFEVAEKLFDDSVVGRTNDGAKGDPVVQCAYEVKGVTDHSSRTSSNAFWTGGCSRIIGLQLVPGHKMSCGVPSAASRGAMGSVVISG
ncbi:Uncharacterised protein [Mycobacteroides abscessus subsp. massiliense]|uniref:hypothetical protein n=1 Tax=Mycobacteroides abscessus TaxID=36809 RepID=UPI0009A7D43D|nr:hypothetical protein [Mycobacteroides abscessus]SKH58530.1 Uncharacterised protein [Mycobacteroides abscessus subsp. massiliense]SKH92739.1 Uncharacterised protein [Mycobacteroides abscessus subsp. massiliense]SKI13208.1 Uncharacterised protein [Mycobacteroides abscessus subsp. massiliense]SKJ98763.1 Uncharacterised protein [Mycobacteroides abscessus subsp. massiliense]SKK28699.1 Uncharacterised protein [Mycobacteroides abscessus subsp. massiliense]